MPKIAGKIHELSTGTGLKMNGAPVEATRSPRQRCPDRAEVFLFNV